VKLYNPTMNPQDIGKIATEEPSTKQPANNQPAIHNPLSAIQPGEATLFEIKRHPIGIIFAYLTAGLLLAILVALTLLLAPSVITNSTDSQVASISAVVFAVAAITTTGFLFIVSKIYWGNRWVITSDSITQVTQTSLFHKQSSQLSLDDIEDATAEQNGILAQLFHYGVLKAETAGHHEKFVFIYCPRPSECAQRILAARERFVQSHEHRAGRHNP